MATARRFLTNSRETTSIPQIPRRLNPKIIRTSGAGSSISSLTEKEKEARRQERLLRRTGSMSGMGNTSMSANQAFFSAQLSVDFLELPQSLREKRELYRHFYNSDEIVAQSIDLHTELPLSKVRLSQPKPRTCPEGFDSPDDYGKYILTFFERMCKRVKLFQRLITAVHHYWLDGTVALFAEDSEVDLPQSVGFDRQPGKKSFLTEEGDAVEEEEEVWVEKSSRKDEEMDYYHKHYRGWERLVLFPMDQIKVTTLNYSDRTRIELIPSDRDRALIDQANAGDDAAQDLVDGIPHEVRDFIQHGKLIPLGTDPDEGSFCYLLMGRQGVGDDLGQSILDRCHLPGTPVTTLRGGQVLQVPIEELDPDTDLVLSHRGYWREFEHGSRSVSESMVVLDVAKGLPVVCTEDHKYPVLRGGDITETLAKNIQPGDYLQVAQVPLPETLSTVDLAEFLEGIEETYTARRSGGVSTQRLVIEAAAETVLVVYEHGETDPRVINRFENKRAILAWAAGLQEPVITKSSELCERFGLHPVTVKELRYELAEFGYYPTVLRNKTLRFEPFKGELPTLPPVRVEKTFKRWLPLDEALGYFLGYWLGDGHITRQPGVDYGVLGIAYGPGVQASRASIEEQIKPFFEQQGVAWFSTEVEGDTSGSATLYGQQDALVRWVAANFGHNCEDKHLPAWVFNTPRPFLMALLRGFVDSDGDVVEKRYGTLSVRMNSTNAVLSDQILLLCTALGIPASKTSPSRERLVLQAQGSLALAQRCYAVHFSHGPSVKAFLTSGFIAKRRREPVVWKDGRSGSRHRVWNGKLFYRVQKVGRANHHGLVYSLNVHEDHTFFAGNFCTFNCLRTLLYRDKLRQAQTQIASRAMTPKRIVWADDISAVDLDDLKEQVDLALVDPDYSIVTNFEVHWEEMGSRDRLLDLSSEYEQTERRLRTGLGVTESLLSGETLYSGDRLKLEVINQRYLFLREILQEYVEEYLFKPVAARKGFVEKDKWGEEVILYPKLSFTRLPLRDSQDTYDALFNLYQKGSIPIELILEMFNIDASDTKTKLENDLFTVNDAVFNEILRGAYGALGNMIVEQTDIVDKIVKYLGLKKKETPPTEEGGGRF